MAVVKSKANKIALVLVWVFLIVAAFYACGAS